MSETITDCQSAALTLKQTIILDGDVFIGTNRRDWRRHTFENDVAFGLRKKDVFCPGAGDDLGDGPAPIDRLFGGDGSDVFCLTPNTGQGVTNVSVLGNTEECFSDRAETWDAQRSKLGAINGDWTGTATQLRIQNATAVTSDDFIFLWFTKPKGGPHWVNVGE